ncbi:unnamed protein product, partial [Rotaria sordida]
MTSKGSPSLITLPVENVYRILDHLDELTIFLSLRNVCMRLNTVVDTYGRYQTLITLNLATNDIGNKGVQSLANALQYNTTLRALNLEVNKIGPEGAQYLANALEKNQTLTNLILICNDIGPNGTLRMLNLRWNDIGPNGAKWLADALETNQ